MPLEWIHQTTYCFRIRTTLVFCGSFCRFLREQHLRYHERYYFLDEFQLEHHEV